MKYFKTFAVILFAAATMVSFSSCSKDDDSKSSSETPGVNPTPGTGDATALYGTEWMWLDEDMNNTEIFEVRVDFNGPLVSLDVWDMYTGIMNLVNYMGTYTYSGGNGTMSLRNSDTDASASATFSVSGNTMTLNFKGATYTLTKRQ